MWNECLINYIIIGDLYLETRIRFSYYLQIIVIDKFIFIKNKDFINLSKA